MPWHLTVPECLLQCQKLRKIFTGMSHKLLLYFTAISNVYRPFIWINYIYQVLSYSMDFKTPWKLWNPLSKAFSSKFRGSGRHSKYNYLQDRANFPKARARQIILIFNTAIIWNHHCTCTVYNSAIHSNRIAGIALQMPKFLPWPDISPPLLAGLW